jgi:hypothetical protein
MSARPGAAAACETAVCAARLSPGSGSPKFLPTPNADMQFPSTTMFRMSQS